MGFNLNDYVTVHERIEEFYSTYPNGRIITEIMEHDEEKGHILIKATVFRETQQPELPAATGHAFEVRGSSNVNKTSHIENCETSAVGRALALLGLKVRGGIASREEMEKVERMGSGGQREQSREPANIDSVKKTIESQKKAIVHLCVQAKCNHLEYVEAMGFEWDTLTVVQGKEVIGKLNKK